MDLLVYVALVVSLSINAGLTLGIIVATGKNRVY